MGWEIKPWIAIEGSGGWLDWGQSTHAFTAAMTTQVAINDSSSTMTFTDPALVAGGSVNLVVNRHWTIRPEVMANVVMHDSRSFVVTTGVVRLAYHFEDHPVTPRAYTRRAR